MILFVAREVSSYFHSSFFLPFFSLAGSLTLRGNHQPLTIPLPNITYQYITYFENTVKTVAP